MTLVFAAVVMYDAMGVRRAAGEQARTLNHLIGSFQDFLNFSRTILFLILTMRNFPPTRTTA